MTPRTMALAIEWTDGRVRYLDGETAEPWSEVLERMGETVMEGAEATVKLVARNVHDMQADVFSIHIEWREKPGSGVIPIKYTEHFLVGALRGGPSEPDRDAVRARPYS